MTTIRAAMLATLALGFAWACSQGADTNPVPTWPPPGTPGSATTSDDGPATFGVDTESVAGSCCTDHGDPGCTDGVIQDCVCQQAPGCCTSGWTGACVMLVDQLGCGSCNGGPLEGGEDPDDSGPPPLPPGDQDCCMAGAGPGCNDATIESCVCTEIAFCCDTGWEEVCASAVEALGCGHCGGSGDTGVPPPPGETGEPPPPPPGGGDCCLDNGTPGCDDAAVESCVCMQDAYCCDTAWDQVCVDGVAEFMCGDCGGAMPPPPPPGTSSCCSAQAGPGCDDQAIADCVCFIDDYCCTTQWDSVCAIFVELFLCGSCG